MKTDTEFETGSSCYNLACMGYVDFKAQKKNEKKKNGCNEPESIVYKRGE